MILENHFRCVFADCYGVWKQSKIDESTKTVTFGEVSVFYSPVLLSDLRQSEVVKDARKKDIYIYSIKVIFSTDYVSQLFFVHN